MFFYCWCLSKTARSLLGLFLHHGSLWRGNVGFTELWSHCRSVFFLLSFPLFWLVWSLELFFFCQRLEVHVPKQTYIGCYQSSKGVTCKWLFGTLEPQSRQQPKRTPQKFSGVFASRKPSERAANQTRIQKLYKNKNKTNIPKANKPRLNSTTCICSLRDATSATQALEEAPRRWLDVEATATAGEAFPGGCCLFLFNKNFYTQKLVFWCVLNVLLACLHVFILHVLFGIVFFDEDLVWLSWLSLLVDPIQLQQKLQQMLWRWVV